MQVQLHLMVLFLTHYYGKKVIDTTFNAAAAATATLTAAQSGTLFLINGAANNVITLPAVSTGNVGVTYDFFLNSSCWRKW